jgi:hypothetical protein
MKENKKQVVFYNAEKNAFLGKYKDRGSLAFEAGFIAELRSALFLPFDSYEEQKTELDKLAEVMGCEVLIVEAEYNVTKLDGSDFERTEREESMKDGIKALLELLAK